MPLCVAHKAATSSPSPVRTRPRTTAAWPLLRTRPWPSFATMLQPGLRLALSSSAKASMSRGTCGIASSYIKAHSHKAHLHHTSSLVFSLNSRFWGGLAMWLWILRPEFWLNSQPRRQTNTNHFLPLFKWFLKEMVENCTVPKPTSANHAMVKKEHLDPWVVLILVSPAWLDGRMWTRLLAHGVSWPKSVLLNLGAPRNDCSDFSKSVQWWKDLWSLLSGSKCDCYWNCGSNHILEECSNRISKFSVFSNGNKKCKTQRTRTE